MLGLVSILKGPVKHGRWGEHPDDRSREQTQVVSGFRHLSVGKRVKSRSAVQR